MNRIPQGVVLAVAISFAAACGQDYLPTAADAAVPLPEAPEHLFDAGTDEVAYKFASYDFLRSAVTDVLGVAPAMPANPGSPLADPVGYLDANRTALGAPFYDAETDLTNVGGAPVAGGLKAWFLASSSACGKAMETDMTRLFPDGTNDYRHVYGLLLGREPSPEEAQRLDELQSVTAANGMDVFATPARKAAIACFAILGSLEFLAEI